MQYLKVQYARTDVLAKNAETYTKESKSSSNSFQSILNSLQTQPNQSKVDSKESSFLKEKSPDANINSSVAKDQQKGEDQKEIGQVKAKKQPEPKKEVEEPVQIEDDANQVYMMIDLAASDADESQSLRNLEFEEAGAEIEFLSDAQVEMETVATAPDSADLEEIASEISMLDNDSLKPKESVKENVNQISQDAAEKVAESPSEQIKGPVESKNVKPDNDKVTNNEIAASERKVFTIFDERTVVVQEEEKKVTGEVREVKVAETNQNAQAAVISDNARANILSTNDQSASATGSTFQQMLSQQIQQNAPEFAKAGTIILKDQNSGSINMILKPESLGNVKISLQLTDKNINGHIVVQSKEAMEAFKENLDLLRHSFQENGFENAQLSLSLADSSSENPFAQNQNGNNGQYIAGRVNKEYGQSGEEIAASSDSSQYSSSSEYQIDVVA